MSPSLPWHCINPSLISTLPRPGIKSWKTPEPSPRTQQHPSLAWYVLRCNRVVWRQSSAFKGCLCRRLGSLSLTSKPHPDPSLTQTRSPPLPISFTPSPHTLSKHQKGEWLKKRNRHTSTQDGGSPQVRQERGKVPLFPGVRTSLSPSPADNPASPRRSSDSHSPGQGGIYPRLGGSEAGSAGRPGSLARPRILPG